MKKKRIIKTTRKNSKKSKRVVSKVTSKKNTKPILSKKRTNTQKPTKLKRIQTGIKGFDKIIGGGFLSNSVNILVGGAGCGKTIFSTQFLLEGIKKGENVLYVTFEEKKDRFFEVMKDLGWDLAKLEKEKKLSFIEYTPEQVKKMLEEGGGEIELVIEESKAKRIVIDSITSFELLFASELEKREASLSLFELLRKWNVTTLLTLEQEAFLEGGIEHISTSLEFEADGIILLYFIRFGKDRIRELEILKMRGTKHSKKLYQFQIGKGGIKILGEGKVPKRFG